MFAGTLTQMQSVQQSSHNISFGIYYVPSITLGDWNKTQSVHSKSSKPEERGKHTACRY